MENKRKKILINFVCWFICALWLLPIVWMIAIAFKPEGANTTNIIKWFLPPFTMDNINQVINNPQANILAWIKNSAIVASLTTVGVILLCVGAAFAFSRIDFFGKKVWLVMIMAGLMVPREATLIPLYLLFKDIKLLNTYFSIIAPSLAAPFGVIILKQFFDGLPDSLFEAAKIDGCGWFRSLIHIAIPLCKPALSSLAIFVFLQGWNDFLWPFISISDPSKVTIPLGLSIFKSQYLTGQGVTMAAAALLSAPIIVVFVMLQKNIVEGIALTGIKG